MFDKKTIAQQKFNEKIAAANKKTGGGQSLRQTMTLIKTMMAMEFQIM